MAPLPSPLRSSCRCSPGRPRRVVSRAAGAGRALAALYAATHTSSLLLFPRRFLVLVLSKVHSVTEERTGGCLRRPLETLIARTHSSGAWLPCIALVAGPAVWP